MSRGHEQEKNRIYVVPTRILSFSFLFLRSEFGSVDSLKVFEALSFLSDRWPSHIFCRQSYCEFYFYLFDFFVFKMRTVGGFKARKK